MLSFVFGVIFFSCSTGESKKTPAELFPENVLPCSDEEKLHYTGGKFVLIRDVPYFENLVGDLYLPSDRVDFPVAIHIHGGGWVAGSRRTPMAEWWGEFFACNGIALYDIEYTLIPKAKSVIQQVREIRCAILWTQTEGKEKYGFGDKIIVLGGSAGGHLTALSSLKNDVDLSSCPWKKDPFPKISAAIPFYGIYDFTMPFENSVRRSFGLGDDPKTISPIYYVNNADFPFLIIHGTSDFIPISQPENFHKKLIGAGKRSELFLVENATHAFDVFPETDFTKKTKERIYNFLLENKLLETGQKPLPEEHDYIKEGIRLLERGYYKHAYLEFNQEKNKNCLTEYGKLIAFSFDILSMLINAQDTNLLEILPGLGLTNSDQFQNIISRIRSSQIKEPDFNNIYESYIAPVINRLNKIAELSKYVVENSCTFQTENGIPIYAGGFNIKMKIGKRFGNEFPLFSLYLVNLFKSALLFFFSHDINLKISDNFLQVLQKYADNQSDIFGLIRGLGVAYYENENLLTFKRPELWIESKKSLVESLRYLSEFIREAFLNVSDNSDVFTVVDKDGNNELSFSDYFSVGIESVEPEGTTHWLIDLSNALQFLPAFGRDYYERLAVFLKDLSDKIKRNEFVNLGEFDKLIPDILKGFLGSNFFPEFISFNIGGFFDARKPLRDFLPEVVNYNNNYIFLVENEMGKSWDISDVFPSDTCYVCPPGERFKPYHGLVSVDGKIISSLQDDGISLEGKFLIGNIGIPYIYYKDPTFGGNLLVFDGNSFVMPDVFLLNKAFAKLLVRVEGILR